MLSIKEIVLVVHVTLVKPSIMQKLDGMNIIIQPKSSETSKYFQNNIDHFLHVLQFQMLQKMPIPGRA